MHMDEKKTLKEQLKRAKKLLASSPKDLRKEREEEVQRLELAVKRAESTVNKGNKDRIEQEALDRLKKEEREKRKAGKGAWYLKNCKIFNHCFKRDAKYFIQPIKSNF